jgi:predicted LPLAT superfamily acyltransferase
MAPEFNPCIVIPVYNHEGPLPGIVARLKPYGIPCLLVDDGSCESCAEVMRGLAAREPWLRYIRQARNRGKGSAVKAGLFAARRLGFSHAVQVDADGQHAIDDLGTFLEAAKAHPEAVVTGRPVYDDSVPKGRYYARYLTHVWVWINTLSFDIADSMCGYRVYPVETCTRLLRNEALGDRMEFDVEILVRLHWQGARIVSIPTRVVYPEDGVSHFRLWRDNALLSRMHAGLFFGMLRRLPRLVGRRFRAYRGEAGHWAAMEETGVLWGMRTLLLVYRLFGRFAFRVVLHPVVSYYFIANAAARSASLEYLRRIGRHYPELGIAGGLWDSYRHFLTFAENLLDKLVVWLDRLDPAQIEFHNRPLLLDLMAQGRGAILLGGHIGNLEICRALADLRGCIHLNILVHTKHAEKFNRLLGSVDERGGKIELIQVTELNPAVAIRLQEKIGRGEFLVLVGDRIPVSGQGRTVRAGFLGEEADFPQGPYLLASLLKCPVYTLFSYPEDGRYRIYLELFAERIDIPRREPQRSVELAGWARRFAERLEFHCRRVPLQWFNFYRFWGTAPSGGPEDARRP